MAKQTIPGTGFWSVLAALINGNFDELYFKAGTGWIDLIGDLTLATGPGIKTPDWVKIADDGAGSTGVYGRGFSPTQEEELVVALHIPHGIVDDIIYPHIHWSPTNTDTGVVRWGIEFTFAKGYSRGVLGTSTIIYIEQTANGTSGTHQLAEVADPGITVSGLETDGLIVARIFRDATHVNDTYTGDAIGLFVDAHIQVERLTTPDRNFPFG